MHPNAFGKYQVVELIGEGGFGRVFKGLDPDLKRPVAIKTCSLSEQEMRERFFREAEIAARLRHPNITTVYDFGREEGEPYLVQEYLTGEDLDRYVGDPDRMSLETKVEVLRQVAEGLEYAHREGVVHRDVKPANVRILDDGTVRIMDFGIARLVEETQRLTQAGMSIGTAGYLSPEQLQGLDVDQRSDIFSFGVLAYELILGKRPFQGESISALFYSIAHEDPPAVREVWPDCPPALTACITRCLEKDREARYPDFGKVIADLRNALGDLRGEGGAPLAAGVGTGEDGGEGGVEGESGDAPGRRKGRRLIPLGLLVGIALVLAVFEVLRFTDRAEPQSSPAPEAEAEDAPEGTSMLPAEEGVTGASEEAPETPPQEASPPATEEVPATEEAPAPTTQETPATQEAPPPAAEEASAPATEEAPAPVEEEEMPFRGSTTLVLLWSEGGDPGSVTSAENAFLEELDRRRLAVVEAGLLAGIHQDAAAVAMVQGMDAASVAELGRRYDAEVVVVGSLRTETAPAAGRFHTGRAVLDLRAYRTSTARLVTADTYQVGTQNTPGELGPSPLAAETAAAREVGRRAAMEMARAHPDLMPRRQGG